MTQRHSARYAAIAGIGVFLVALLSIPVCAFIWDPSPFPWGQAPRTQMVRLEAYAIVNTIFGVLASIAVAAIVGLWVENYRAVRSFFSRRQRNGHA